MVIQFIIFFLLGLSILFSIGQSFKYQSEMLKERFSDDVAKLTNSYFSSMIVSMWGCKECEFVNFSTNIPNTTAEHYLQIKLDDGKLIVVKLPGGEGFVSSVHKLNESINFIPSFSSSVQTITLTFNKTKNYLQVV